MKNFHKQYSFIELKKILVFLAFSLDFNIMEMKTTTAKGVSVGYQTLLLSYSLIEHFYR